MNDNINCSLAEGFSLLEKIYAQMSFFSMGVIGTVGILLADWPWILPYIVIIWYGGSGNYNEAFSMSKVSASL